MCWSGHGLVMTSTVFCACTYLYHIITSAHSYYEYTQDHKKYLINLLKISSLRTLIGMQELFGREVISCPSSSCAGRCGEVSERNHLCYCDVRCHVLGDCCPDAHRLCFAAVENDTFGWTPVAIIIRQSRQCISVRVVTEEKDTPMTYWTSSEALDMIVSCPDVADDQEECRDTDSSLVQAVPVCHGASQLIYRNVGCAKCHGIDPTELLPFQIWMGNCPGGMNFSDATGKPTDPADMTPPQRVCPKDTYYYIPDECVRIAQRMRCFHSTNTVLNSWSPCHLYQNPVVSHITIRTSIVYKNQFCVPDEHVDSLICYKEGKNAYLQLSKTVKASFAILVSFANKDPKITMNHLGEMAGNSPSLARSEGLSPASNGGTNVNVAMYMYHVLLGIYTLWEKL